MRARISVRPATLEEAFAVHAQVPELRDINEQTIEDFQKRIYGKTALILCAESEGENVGYTIAYDKGEEPHSIYWWISGVLPAQRRKGVRSALADEVEEWGREHQYMTAIAKTGNNRRASLMFLLQRGFSITDVIQREDYTQNGLVLMKDLRIESDATQK